MVDRHAERQEFRYEGQTTRNKGRLVEARERPDYGEPGQHRGGDVHHHDPLFIEGGQKGHHREREGDDDQLAPPVLDQRVELNQSLQVECFRLLLHLTTNC